MVGLRTASPALLVVDDEPDILAAFKGVIEASLGVPVLTAQSGEEGLQLLETEPIAGVVSDYKMPGMDGIAFLTEVRRRWPNVPRLMFTAYGNDEVVALIKDAAIAQDVVAKGGDPLVFLDHVRALLASGGSAGAGGAVGGPGAQELDRHHGPLA
jgi:CheY-like chemotaxis protein